MKKTVTMGLGGRNFTIDDDAYNRLDTYLNDYAATLQTDRDEVMEEIEMRIADLFRDRLGGRDVVDIAMVNEVAKQLGLPDANNAGKGQYAPGSKCDSADGHAVHKFYRDTDDRKIGGVCSGMAAYFDVDVVLIRIIFLILIFCGTLGLWFYIICCIVAPSAYTASEKCQLRGIPCTAENLKRFTTTVR